MVNEDFPADARSSRNACLDAVASSDAYILIIGERGGWRAPSGKLVVEEEYQEARARRLPVMMFFQGISRDADAEELTSRLSDYVDGQFRVMFESIDQLQTAVERAVGALINQSKAKTMSEDIIPRRVAQKGRIADDASIRLVIAPERDEEIVSPVHIISPAFTREVHTIGHGGASPIFDFSQPKKNAVVGDALSIHQHDAHGRHDGVDDVWLSVNERGVIEIESNITSWRPSGAGLLGAGMVIMIADVEERLRQSFAFTHAFFEQRDPYKRHQRFHYDVVALSLGFRRFTRDTTPRNSYTMNMSRTDQPLVVYPRPRLIGRDDIANPDGEITRIVALLERSDRA